MTAVDLTLFEERFAELAVLPGGVDRLRQLILQLAVTGKLVPQDPADEPAAVLLEKIKQEKDRLIKEGKIKKTKPLPPISDEEIPYSLPKGWEWVRLDDVCSMITDGTHHTPKYIADGIPFISVKDISKGTLDFSNTRFISNEEHENLIKRCHPEYGDILLTKVGTTGIAKAIETHIAFSIFVSVALLKIQSEYLFPLYLENLLNSPYVRKQSKDGTEGVGNKNLVLRKIKAFILPIPPLSEQKRIVSAVDRLMSLCDRLESVQTRVEETRSRLNRAGLAGLTECRDPNEFRQQWLETAGRFDVIYNRPENVEPLKQAILQLAVTGKLVPQDPADEPAAVLLEKIKQEKDRLIKEGKIKKTKPLPPITEEEIPYSLPMGWEWARFPEIGTFGRGKSKHRPRNDPALYIGGQIPLIQTGDVARSYGTINTYTALYNETGRKQSRMWPKGTICITIAANIADSGILGFDACFPDSVVGFIPHDHMGSVKYFEYFLRTVKDHLTQFAPSTAQKNINLGILEKVLVPLPPLSEQKRIVSAVDRMLALCDRLADRLEQREHIGEKLLAALLNRLV